MAVRPTATDLQAMLIGAGIISNPSDELCQYLSLDAKVQSAIEEFEQLTGYQPFCCAETATTVPYDIRKVNRPFGAKYYPWLDLDGGFVSVSNVIMNYSPTNAGDTLVAGTNYVLSPAVNPSKGLPYTIIELLYPNWTYPFVSTSYPYSIRITGMRGFSLEYPARVSQAILMKAGSLATQQIAAQSGGVSVVKLGEDTFDFRQSDSGKRTGQYSPTISAWNEEFKDTCNRYRRLLI